MIKFRQSPNGFRMEIAYDKVVALNHHTMQIITSADSWTVAVLPADWDRVVSEISNWYSVASGV